MPKVKYLPQRDLTVVFVRLNPETKTWLKAVAQDNGHSVSYEARCILEYAHSRHGKQGRKAPAARGAANGGK